MPVRAVVFDFGGVLVRSYDATARNRWIKRLAIDETTLMRTVFDSEASALATIGQAPESAIRDSVARDLGLEEEVQEEFWRDFWSGDRINQELVDFMRGLRPRFKTAILSNAWPNAREVFTNKYGLGDAVDTILISAEEGLAKPDPRIYYLTCERLQIRPEEMVFVDDFDVNIKAARELGIKGVHFRSTEQAIAEVKKHLEE